MSTHIDSLDQEGTLAEVLEKLGNIPLHRIRTRPAPGMATEDDVIAARESPARRLCELVDGVLVEKPMGYHESILAGEILALLRNHVRPRKLGAVSGADSFHRLMPGLVRLPDVAFVAWD